MIRRVGYRPSKKAASPFVKPGDKLVYMGEIIVTETLFASGPGEKWTREAGDKMTVKSYDAPNPQETQWRDDDTGETWWEEETESAIASFDKLHSGGKHPMIVIFPDGEGIKWRRAT